MSPDLTKKEHEENKLLSNKLTIMTNGQNQLKINNRQIVPRGKLSSSGIIRLRLHHITSVA